MKRLALVILALGLGAGWWTLRQGKQAGALPSASELISRVEDLESLQALLSDPEFQEQLLSLHPVMELLTLNSITLPSRPGESCLGPDAMDKRIGHCFVFADRGEESNRRFVVDYSTCKMAEASHRINFEREYFSSVNRPPAAPVIPVFDDPGGFTVFRKAFQSRIVTAELAAMLSARPIAFTRARRLLGQAQDGRFRYVFEAGARLEPDTPPALVLQVLAYYNPATEAVEFLTTD